MSYRLKSLREQFLRITALFVVLFVVSVGAGLHQLSVAQAVSPPNIFSYQGRVLNNNGVPVSDTSVSMKFELYTALSGGTCVWSNSSADCDSNTPASTTARSVSLNDGLFTARLGDTADGTPWAEITDSVFGNNNALFLQIYIAGETLTPRKPIDAVPYANNAETLDGIDSTQFDLDRVYDNDSDKVLNVDTTDLEFSLDGAGLDFMIDLQSTGDFILQDTGTDFFTINEGRQIIYDYDGSSNTAFTLFADSATLGLGQLISVDALTTGLGLSINSSSSALTSATLFRADHTATYASGTTAYTGKGLDIVRDITADGGATTVNMTGPYASITSSAATSNGGTLTESGPLFALTQNNASATGATLHIDANQTGTVNGIHLDSEIASGNAFFLDADGVTTGAALNVSVDNLTTGYGVGVNSTSTALTDGFLLYGDHQATYTSGTTNYTGQGLYLNRAVTSSGGGTTVNMTGPHLSITNASTTASGGTLNDSASLLVLTQNNTAATGSALLIDANQTGATGLTVDSEATTSSAVGIAADALTTGQALSITTGNLTDDSGTAITIDTQETTETADIVRIQSDFGSSNNNIYRIEADGEVFSDIGFTAGAFSTNYWDGELQTTANFLLDIDGGNLNFDQATVIGDGADALTLNSSGVLTVDDTDITGTGALQINSGGSGDLVFNSASNIVSVGSTNDFSVGVASLAAPFSIDESGNLMRLGDGSGTNAQIDMYASDGDTGAITYTTSDEWSFTGGNFIHTANADYGAGPASLVGGLNTSSTISTGASGGAGLYQYAGGFSSVTSSATEGAGAQHEPIGFYGQAFNSTASGQVESLYGVKGLAENTSTNGSAVGTQVAGIQGIGTNNAAATTIANVVGVLGETIPINGIITTARGVQGTVGTGGGTITTAVGGDFNATAAGTTRVGVLGSASGGTNNYAGYFDSSAVHVETNNTPSTATTATGAGDLYVDDALEIAGAGSSSTSVLDVNGNTTTFIATFTNSGNNDNREGIVIQACSTASGSTPTSACNYLEFRDGAGTAIGAVEGDGAGGVTNASAGSDYAELFDGTYADFEEGDLVALNSAGQVEVATNNDDVIGVLSVNPNTLGNWVDGWQDHGGYVPVALLGQVPVKVNAEGGSIAVGDYISLSSSTGVAKKADGVGYTIGRALESHSSGSGTIMVFIQPGWQGIDVLTDNSGEVAVSSALTMLGDTDSSIEMTMFTDVTSSSDYQLSILNDDDTEVAFVNNEGDLAIAGRLYPSDRGTLQTDKYIYYDGSTGVGGDFMRTNASGWGAGSYDFAEMFPSAQTLAAGEVVIFADDDEHVMRSVGLTYDQRIAGIISTQPGFLAGENIEGHVPVALSGRVPTYVSGENGDIAIGDPLTTSSKDGYAMKATEAGPIVGYAMEAFSGDTGAIIVFVRPSYYDGGDVDEVSIADNVISNLGNTASLDLSGTININSGQIINIAAITGMGQQWSIASDGTIRTKGDVIQLVDSYQGESVETYATFSRQRTIELSGTAELKDGAAAVRFEHEDPLFNDIIANDVPYRVFLTADQPTGPLYAVNRSGTGFSIRESTIGEERSSANVDWMVVAYHKDHAPEQTDDLEPESEEEDSSGSNEGDSSDEQESIEEDSETIEEETASEEVEESDPSNEQEETVEEPQEETQEQAQEEEVDQTDEEEVSDPEPDQETATDDSEEEVTEEEEPTEESVAETDEETQGAVVE